MKVYLYAADFLCEDCGDTKLEELKTAPGWSYDEENDFWTAPSGERFGRDGFVVDSDGNAIHATDTDTFPAGPYPDGGGESDSPNHCDDCRTFLENPLTAEGEKYVKETIFAYFGEHLHVRPLRDDAVLREWANFYDISLNDLFDYVKESK